MDCHVCPAQQSAVTAHPAGAMHGAMMACMPCLVSPGAAAASPCGPVCCTVNGAEAAVLPTRSGAWENGDGKAWTFWDCACGTKPEGCLLCVGGRA